MQMQGRSFTSESYRYGYQGSEKDNEVNSGMYTTEFRALDVRLGRWFTPDPITQPWQSPYGSMDNNPIALTDALGLEAGGGDPVACPSFVGTSGNEGTGFDPQNASGATKTMDFPAANPVVTSSMTNGTSVGGILMASMNTEGLMWISQNTSIDDITKNITGPNPTPVPQNVKGTIEYYQFRLYDLMARHPGVSNYYYLNYGYKYAWRFSNDVSKRLSSKGKIWVAKARKELQLAMEAKLAIDANIELDDKAFTKFAFGTHADSYIRAGILELSIVDKLVIMAAPDPKDWEAPLVREEAIKVMKAQIAFYLNNPDILLQHILEAGPDATKRFYELVEQFLPGETSKLEGIKK